MLWCTSIECVLKQTEEYIVFAAKILNKLAKIGYKQTYIIRFDNVTM